MSFSTKLAKLDFPKYNGTEDPTSWICRVEQFFDYQQSEEGEKLPLASYHLEGQAYMWYQLFKDSEEVLTWEAFKAAMHTHYGHTAFDDHFGDLTKLQQTGSVREYQLQFERLLSRVQKLSTQHQLGCFVSGLKGNFEMRGSSSQTHNSDKSNWVSPTIRSKKLEPKESPKFRRQTHDPVGCNGPSSFFDSNPKQTTAHPTTVPCGDARLKSSRIMLQLCRKICPRS